MNFGSAGGAAPAPVPNCDRFRSSAFGTGLLVSPSIFRNSGCETTDGVASTFVIVTDSIAGCGNGSGRVGSNVWPNRCIVNLSKPNTMSLQMGHINGRFVTLIKLVRNESTLEKFGWQHNGQGNIGCCIVHISDWLSDGWQVHNWKWWKMSIFSNFLSKLFRSNSIRKMLKKFNVTLFTFAYWI